MMFSKVLIVLLLIMGKKIALAQDNPPLDNPTSNAVAPIQTESPFHWANNNMSSSELFILFQMMKGCCDRTSGSQLPAANPANGAGPGALTTKPTPQRRSRRSADHQVPSTNPGTGGPDVAWPDEYTTTSTTTATRGDKMSNERQFPSDNSGTIEFGTEWPLPEITPSIDDENERKEQEGLTPAGTIWVY